MPQNSATWPGFHAAADLDVRWFEEQVYSDDLSGLALVRTAVAYPPPGRDASQSLKVGETAELELFLHCGLRYALIDGETWETDPLGDGSAPRGWPELLTGTATRTAEDTVVFTSPGVVDRLVFHPATGPTDWVCF